jgi:uncharacterized membrane protein YccC
MSENKSSNKVNALGLDMSAVAEMRQHARAIGAPLFADEQVLFRIERVARRLSITARRARAYWYGEAASIPADHMDRARQIARQPIEQEASDAFAELQNRIARLEAALAVSDPDFHGPSLDALRVSAGRPDRAVD